MLKPVFIMFNLFLWASSAQAFHLCTDIRAVVVRGAEMLIEGQEETAIDEMIAAQMQAHGHMDTPALRGAMLRQSLTMSRKIADSDLRQMTAVNYFGDQFHTECTRNKIWSGIGH